MHSNLYLSVEYARSGKKWNCLLRLADIGAASNLQALLGGIETSDLPPNDCLVAKGFPDDVTNAAIEEDSLTIDDDLANSDVGDVLENVRICTKADAQQWVEEGVARYLRSDYRVTDPEAYGQSWLSLDEVRGFISTCEQHDCEHVHILKALAASMTSLNESGYDTRIIYWFSYG